MKSTLLASSALALVLSTGIAFAGPTATITDAGNSNVNLIDQSAKQNSATSVTIEQLSGTDGGSLSTNAYIRQAGAGQIDGKISQKNGTENYALLDQSDGVATANTLTSATITQDGTGSLSSTVLQSGDHNTAIVTQGGSNNTGNVTQNGVNNIATVGQIGNGSQAYIEQLGSNGQVYVGYGAVGQDGGEYAHVKQTGASEIARIDQAGTQGSNYTRLEQSGPNAYSEIHQNGGNGTVTAFQTGAGAGLVLTQSGDTNAAYVNQHGTYYTYSQIDQLGTGNGLTLDQSGSANTSAWLYQSGNGNGMLVTQNAAGQDYVTAIVMQTGDRNYAGVNQSANNVRGEICQSGNDNTAYLKRLRTSLRTSRSPAMAASQPSTSNNHPDGPAWGGGPRAGSEELAR